MIIRKEDLNKNSLLATSPLNHVKIKTVPSLD